jgi:hypothetical protein
MQVSGQLHDPAALPQGKSAWYPLDRRLGEPQSHSGRGGDLGLFATICPSSKRICNAHVNTTEAESLNLSLIWKRGHANRGDGIQDSGAKRVTTSSHTSASWFRKPGVNIIT